jgi:hypothetical protein
MRSNRSFRRSLLIAAVPLMLASPAARAFTVHEEGGGDKKDPNPVQALICSVDKTHEGCPKTEPPK